MKKFNLFFDYNKCLKIGLLAVLLFFILPLSSHAQSNNQMSVWVGFGSGLYTGGYEIDDSHLLSGNVNLNWKNHLVSLQINHSPEYVFNEENYKLNEYGILYGYMKDFREGSFFVASGISYFDLGENTYIRANKEELVNGKYEEIYTLNPSGIYKKWGVPIKLGISTRINKWFAIEGAYMMNINENQTYLGYNVSFQFGLFGNKGTLVDGVN